MKSWVTLQMVGLLGLTWPRGAVKGHLLDVPYGHEECSTMTLRSWISGWSMFRLGAGLTAEDGLHKQLGVAEGV